MKVIKTKLDGLLIFKRQTYYDDRGFLKVLFEQKKFKKKFIFDYFSLSKKNVIRGLHLQYRKPQVKIISVISGRIFDIVLDCRKNSKTFGKYYTMNISSKDNVSLYIPEGFAHGFCSLTDNTILHYRNSNYRNKKYEIGILWKDRDLNIKWPVKNPLISLRDKRNITFSKFLDSKNFKKM